MTSLVNMHFSDNQKLLSHKQTSTNTPKTHKCISFYLDNIGSVHDLAKLSSIGSTQIISMHFEDE